MKPNSSRKALATLATSIVALSSAQALTLVYETGPLTGQPFNLSAGNPISFKFTGFATGETYIGGGGGTFGFGAGGAAGNVAAGIAALDAIPGVGTQNVANPSSVQTVINGVAQGLGSVGTEDGWSIYRVTTITDQLTGDTIWSQAVKGTQITALASGLKDFYTTTVGTEQIVNGVGGRLDLFEVSTAGFPNASTFNSLLGPTGHAGDNLGNGSVYAGTTNGAPILTLRTAAGFIHPNGVLGGLATEFESKLNLSGSGGNGNLSSAFFDVVGGSLASDYNTNRIASGIVGGRVLNADISAEFTQTTFGVNGLGQPITNNGWTATVNDPLLAYPVPEPSTALFGLGCMLPFVASRRRKPQSAQ